MRTYGVILAAGNGQRYGSPVPKQFLVINGRMVLEWTLKRFQESPCIDRIIVVLHPDFADLGPRLRRFAGKIHAVVPGGQTRRESSWAGISEIPESDARVLVHDAVRPLVTTDLIERVARALVRHKAVYPVVPLVDTVAKVDSSASRILEIPPRHQLAAGQTPQGFHLRILKLAHQLAMADPDVDKHVTNDCGLVARYNIAEIATVIGEVRNIKLTYQEHYDIMKIALHQPADSLHAP